jgi:hypothetical protein
MGFTPFTSTFNPNALSGKDLPTESTWFQVLKFVIEGLCVGSNSELSLGGKSTDEGT